MDGSDFMKARLKMELKSISEIVVSTIAALVTMARLSKSFLFLGWHDGLFQPCTQASSRYSSYQKRLGSECEFSRQACSWRQIRNRRGQLVTRLVFWDTNTAHVTSSKNAVLAIWIWETGTGPGSVFCRILRWEGSRGPTLPQFPAVYLRNSQYQRTKNSFMMQWWPMEAMLRWFTPSNISVCCTYTATSSNWRFMT